MKITTKTKVKLILESDQDVDTFRSLFHKLNGYIGDSHSLQHAYKTTIVGYAGRIDFSLDEKQLITFISNQITKHD